MASDPSSDAARLARAILGCLALGLVGIGQYTLLLSPRPTWPGPIIAGLGMVLFLWASLSHPPAPLVRLVVRLRLSPQGLWLACAVGLSVAAALLSVSFQRLARTNYLPVVLLWVGAWVAYALAFAPAAERPDWRGWWRRYRREALWLALVVLLGAVLRFYLLGSLPRVINGDEGLLGQAALNTRQAVLANPFVLVGNFGGFYLQGMNLAMDFLGQTPFALRLLPAVGGTLAIVSVYLLARWLFGARVALTAALLLALSHAHIHFSRTVAVGYIQGTLLIPLELYLFQSGLEKRSALRMALGGLVLGVHFGIYLSAQIIVAFLIVYLLVAAAVCRPLIQRAARLVPVFWGGVLVAALPEAVHAWLHPEQFLERLNADGTFQSGWLASEMAESGRSVAVVLVDRISHAFLSLNYYPAIDFYGARTPLLDVITGVLFLAGLVIALWRTRDAHYLLLNGFFWSATVAVGIFAIPPSADSYRMLIALPAALTLAGVGYEQLLGAFGLAGSGRSPARVGLSLALVAAVALLNLRAYFVDFVLQCQYGGDPQTRFASYLGNFLRQVDREAEVYLLSDDVVQYGTHPSVDFLSRKLPVTNVPESVNTLRPEPNSVIIATAARADELRAWARANPGGQLERQYDCEQLMLVAYVLPER
jgi:4-amino-4-deoxy-L-arabinose transferase-like glycosyltransferase